jgi:hypothetical protein
VRRNQSFRDQEGDPMNKTGHPAPWRRRHLGAAGLALIGLLCVLSTTAATAQASHVAPPAAATGVKSAQTIHIVAHEQHHVFLDQGPHGPSLGDESIFAGILRNASDTTRVGEFGGTLTSISTDDSLLAATVDLKLPGGQIAVQGVFVGAASRIVHAVTGGTGIYRNARGVFSFTEPSSGVLDMTLQLLL